jgi:hypothetical protein
MCELCAANERNILEQSLKNYLRPGVRIMVKHSLDDHDSTEIALVNDADGTNITLSTVGQFCWESEQHNNIVRFPG